MTVHLPDDRSHVAAGSGPGAAAGGAFEPPDWGARLVKPLAETERAARLCDVDCTLAGAARELERFAQTLAGGDSDIDTWPETFAAGAQRVRDVFAQRLPDGPERDRFDAGFDLFAKAKAVETRSFATQRRVTRSREDLRAALDGYAEIAATAITPVAADFALDRGAAAIRSQADAQVIAQDEAEALAAAFRTDIAERRGRQFVLDDPEAAIGELSRPRGGAFSELPADRRSALRDDAERRRAALAETAADEAASRGFAESADALRRRQAFETAFSESLRAGTATPLEIADGLAGGEIDIAAASRLHLLYAEVREARAERAQSAFRMERRIAAGLLPDPADPGDVADAGAWLAMLLSGETLPGAEDAFDGGRLAQGDRQATARILRDAGRRLGFLPPALRRTLALYWESGDPGLMQLAAEAEADIYADPAAGADFGADRRTDRSAFRALVAAGLDPAVARDRVLEMSAAREAAATVRHPYPLNTGSATS